MRILVTGGSGYIGSRLLVQLAERPDVHEILDIDIKPPAISHPKVRYVERSVAEPFADLFTEAPVDLAMHLAWVLDPLHDSARQRLICIGGTKNFLDGCHQAAVKHVFHMSSATAYGAHPSHAEPVSEEADLLPEHHFQYSSEKREAEAIYADFRKEHPDLLCQWARPCIVAGPNVTNFIFRMLERPVAFRATGLEPKMQLVHEDDVAAALDAIVSSENPGCFNIAAPGTITLRDIARRLGTPTIPLPFPVLYGICAFAWKLNIRFLSEAPPGFLYHAFYPWLVSSRRLEEELGFSYRYTCDETLAAYVEAHPR